jgi:hypothetical protein
MPRADRAFARNLPGAANPEKENHAANDAICQ